MQECYLRALRHFDTYRGPAIKPWLFAILRNVCRAEFARRSGAALTMDGETKRTRTPPRSGRRRRSSPEAEMLRQRDAETIRRLVAELPDPFREAIVLREINDLSYREIADVVGVPVGTVMSRLARARSMLRKAWIGRGRTANMTCAETEILLHALLDGELDAGHAREVESACGDLSALRRTTAWLIASCSRRCRPRSCALRRRRACAGASRRRCRRRRPRARRAAAPCCKGFAMGTALSAAMAASLVIAVIRTDQDQRVLGDVVSAHVRSLQGEHLTDVQTSDQHTVKPWFNGKLDVAPPVVDLTAQGFTLIGGRLDYLDGKAVASIVYRRRTHVINLFVAQAAASERQRREDRARCRDSTFERWNAQGLEFWAVSDIDADELQEFVDKFEAGLRQVGRT